MSAAKKHMKIIAYTQLQVRKLIPSLQVAFPKSKKYLRPDLQHGEKRLNVIVDDVTALIKEERLELFTPKAIMARSYTERLISEAVKYGDTHNPTMEIANFYLREKQLIHKLFKVLVPRYKDYETNYTNLYKAPMIYPLVAFNTCVLELKGNPFPPLVMKRIPTHNWINNVLLEEVRKDISERTSVEKH